LSFHLEIPRRAAPDMRIITRDKFAERLQNGLLSQIVWGVAVNIQALLEK
jgi:hypothetical protein